jgi:hypothetical protein
MYIGTAVKLRILRKKYLYVYGGKVDFVDTD